MGNPGTGARGQIGLRRWIVGAAVAAAGAWGLAGPAAEASAGDGVLVYERDGGAAQEQRILDYWTPKRIRRAEPLDAVIARAGSSVRHGQRDGRGRASYVPAAAPGAPAAAERSGVAATARTRTDFQSGPVVDPTVFPNTTNGKIYGRIPRFGGYECSGTVVDAPNFSVVFTAGHCVAESVRRLASRLIFIPSYDRRQEPFGRWAFQSIVVTDQWAERENFNFDFAAIVMSPQPETGLTVQGAVGARGIAFGQPRKQPYSAFGYPFNKVRGQVMWSCVSRYVRNDPHPAGGGPLPFGIGCDMSSGASGGGWVIAGELLNSVSSFGYDARGDLLYGPYFGGQARRIYSAAAAVPVQ